jgi:hypothetical protein
VDPLNSTVDLDAPELLSPLQYLVLDMELFNTVMTEVGIDADSTTARGLSGANRVLEVLRTPNPRPKQREVALIAGPLRRRGYG